MLRGHLRDFAIARIIVPALCVGLPLTGCSRVASADVTNIGVFCL